MAFRPLLVLVLGGRRSRTFLRASLKFYTVPIFCQIARKMLQVDVQWLQIARTLEEKRITTAIFLLAIIGWSDEVV
jgi:ABC-type nitrate/sulfonate/bicarbonate transport system permease component